MSGYEFFAPWFFSVYVKGGLKNWSWPIRWFVSLGWETFSWIIFQLLRQNFIPFYIHSRSYIWPLHPLAEAGQAAIRIDRRESIKHVRSFRQIFHLNSNLNGALIANARGRLKIHNPYIWTNHRCRPRSHLQFSRSKFKFFTPFVVESSSSHHFRLPWNIWQCGSGSLNRAADRTQHNKELLSYLPLNSFLRVV